jgi:hypothetical protein
MRKDNVDLPPIVTAGFGTCAIAAVVDLGPFAMEVVDVVEFRKKTAFGAYEYQGIRHEADATRLVECEMSLIDNRLILVI